MNEGGLSDKPYLRGATILTKACVLATDTSWIFCASLFDLFTYLICTSISDCLCALIFLDLVRLVNKIGSRLQNSSRLRVS